MSTLLQRMARRARESPLDAAPRIEPVLMSSFGPRTGEGAAAAVEEHAQTEAAAAEPEVRGPGAAFGLTEPPEATEPDQPLEPPGRREPRERDETPEVRTGTRRAHASDAWHAETNPQRQPHDAPKAPRHPRPIIAHATTEAHSPLPAPTTDTARRQRDRQAKIEPVLAATSATSASARESPREMHRREAAPPPRATEGRIAEHTAHDTPSREPTAIATTAAPPRAAPRSPADAADAPTVTISFGRVEVRQASAPPAPPRSPFRPAMSLDAFLRRGGGNAR